MRSLLSKVKATIKAQLWRLALSKKISIAGNKPKLFYLMGHGDKFPNLGDQAQAAAIPIWLKKHFNMPIIEVKCFEVASCLPTLKEKIQKDDLVFLHSGGNFGDDWYETQLMRESIISTLGFNPIIQLPQTIFYSDTESGKAASNQTKRLLEMHPSVLLFGRDSESTEIAKKLFDKTTVLSRPDMVLSLQETVENRLGMEISRRSKIFKRVLLILRNDKEGIYEQDDKTKIAGIFELAGYETEIWDTDVNDIFPDDSKFETIAKYLKYISGFDAVVTDRYHGLIFSVLVKRPCLVLKTHNHKLTSAFDWFENVNFVCRVESTEDLVPALTQLQSLGEYVSPRWNTLHFDPMADDVKRYLAKPRAE